MRELYDIFIDEENEVYQVRTKEDLVVIEFSDNVKEEIFNDIIDLYDRHDFYSYPQLKKELSKKYADDKVIDVIKELVECALLNNDNFGKEDFDLADASSQNGWSNDSGAISDKKLGFIGEAELGQKIREAAMLYEYSAFEILEADDSLNKESIEKFIGGIDFLIIDQSLWSPYHIDLINTIALKRDMPWLFIEGMIDKSNYSIGPIFHGKATGCYDCYSSRLRSNDEFSSYTNAYEEYLRKEKKFSKPEPVSPLIKQYIASIVILDISKYIGEWFIPETWRSVLVFNTGSYEVTQHPFLKAPICYTCKPELDYSPAPWFESVTL